MPLQYHFFFDVWGQDFLTLFSQWVEVKVSLVVLVEPPNLNFDSNYELILDGNFSFSTLVANHSYL